MQETQRCVFNPWVTKIPQNRKWQPTPVFMPGEFHGQRNLGGYSSWGCKESDLTEHTLHLQYFYFKCNFIMLPLKSLNFFLFMERSGIYIKWYEGFPGGASSKEPACQCRRHKRCKFDPWVVKIPWRRAWQSIPVFLPGESHGERSLVAYSPQVTQSWT